MPHCWVSILHVQGWFLLKRLCKHVCSCRISQKPPKSSRCCSEGECTNATVVWDDILLGHSTSDMRLCAARKSTESKHVLQDWVNAYQQNRAAATAELLTLLTQVPQTQPTMLYTCPNDQTQSTHGLAQLHVGMLAPYSIPCRQVGAQQR